jgi:hypothetical protein
MVVGAAGERAAARGEFASVRDEPAPVREPAFAIVRATGPD